MEECETTCPLKGCPLFKTKANVPFLETDMVNSIRKNTEPFCFHCGVPYVKDEPHCTETHSTWKPNCNCLNKSTIRVVTG